MCAQAIGREYGRQSAYLKQQVKTAKRTLTEEAAATTATLNKLTEVTRAHASVCVCVYVWMCVSVCVYENVC